MKQSFKYLFIFGYAIVVLACSHSKHPTGKALLTGKFSGLFPVEQTYTVKVSIPVLVGFDASKQFDEYETQLEMDGNFSLSIPLFRAVYALFSVNDEELGGFFLSPEKETKIELSLNDTNKIQVKPIEGRNLAMEDFEKINKAEMEFVHKVFDPDNGLIDLRWNMSPEEYKNYILQWTDKQISAIVDDNKDLPENLKQLMRRELKWFTFTNYLFNYEHTICYLYENKRNRNEINDTIFKPVKPNKDYYSFLAYFDWNDSPVLKAPSYSKIFQNILVDSVLNIPSITNQSLANWLKEVKATISPVIGSNSDLFYDMLILHAYMKHLDEDLIPLSKQQIEDIKNYFKNPTYAKYLFVKNETFIKITKIPLVIKEIPKANKEKLIEAIVSSYKGKAVVVDFWATWCGPCIEAIKESEKLKEEFSSKNVAFVYITDASSPKVLWEKKIQEIGGEHYYLTDEESESISSSKTYGFDVIPTYLLFNSNGNFVNKISSYPGNEKMRAMIEELLP